MTDKRAEELKLSREIKVSIDLQDEAESVLSTPGIFHWTKTIWEDRLELARERHNRQYQESCELERVY